MATSTLDPEAIARLARTLDRLAPEFTDAERGQLRALLAVAVSEAGGRAGTQPEEPEVEAFALTGDSFSDFLRPLIVTSGGGIAPIGGAIPGGTKTSGSSGSSGSGTGGKK